MESVLAYGRRIGTRWSLKSSPVKSFLWFYDYSAQISCFSFWNVHVSCTSRFDNHTAQGHSQMSFKAPNALYIFLYSLKKSRKPKILPLSAGTTISRTQVMLFDKFSFLLLPILFVGISADNLIRSTEFIKIHYWFKATVRSICHWFTFKLKIKNWGVREKKVCSDWNVYSFLIVGNCFLHCYILTNVVCLIITFLKGEQFGVITYLKVLSW